MPGQYTWGERFRLARLEVKAARQVIATGDENTDDRRQNRIHDRAEERYYRNADAALGLLRTADNELARAEAALRAAKPGKERDEARRTRNDAKSRQRRADVAARKYR